MSKSGALSVTHAKVGQISCCFGDDDHQGSGGRTLTTGGLILNGEIIIKAQNTLIIRQTKGSSYIFIVIKY